MSEFTTSPRLFPVHQEQLTSGYFLPRQDGEVMNDDVWRKRMIDAEWDQAYDEWISGTWMNDHECLCNLDGGLMPGEHDLRCPSFIRPNYEPCSWCGGHGMRTLPSGDIGDCSYCDGSGIER